MNEQKEMSVEANPPSSRFRYWFTPPESLKVKVADIEPFVPKANWKIPPPADLTVEIPAGKIFSKNVPRIPLRLLAELLPDHLSASDGLVKLPAAKLAASYRLVGHVEELLPEPPPEPEGPAAPPEAAIASAKTFDAPEADAANGSMPPDPTSVATPPPAGPEPLKTAPANAPAPNLEPPAPMGDEQPVAPPVEPPRPAPEETRGTPAKFPPRRTGSFVGLPLFRRKTPAAVQPPPPPAPVSVSPAEPPEDEGDAPRSILPEAVRPVPEEPPVTVGVPAQETVPQIEPEFSQPPALPVRMLPTEHFSGQPHHQEIVEQEPLQALFLTEETMTVNRVIELCGGLPGINSCVLAHGSVVVASHNVPDGVDLVSISAHAANMLQAMRDSSARMGIGTVPAVTLHTEKGVISFFNREDLTMLVFHKDRGFVPGVREKMAAVLGELTKARLTLSVGDDRPD
ncbi:MAG: hypothetical protein WC076_01895 [Terrimicrobiaceae bacterium]